MYRTAPLKPSKSTGSRRLCYSDSEINILSTLSHYPNNALVKLHAGFEINSLIALFTFGLIDILNVNYILPHLRKTNTGEYYLDDNDISKKLMVKLTQIGKNTISDANEYGW